MSISLRHANEASGTRTTVKTLQGSLPPDVLARGARLSWKSVLAAFGIALSGLAGLIGGVGAVIAGEITDAFRAHTAGATLTVDHSAWDALLKSYVKPAPDGVNRVDYQAFKASAHETLRGYISKLESSDPSKLDKPEQIAFWANLYNAKTVDIILEHYPVKSIREIDLEKSLLSFIKKSVGAGGPWKAEVVKVNGRPLSLDNIEHDILRPIYKNPRIHYALNCASYGCPNLQRDAFTGVTLDTQLNAGAQAFINHPRGFKVDSSRIRASSIYDWFQADFGSTPASVLDHARGYASPELKASLDGKTSIDSFDYDWRLNDIER